MEYLMKKCMELLSWYDEQYQYTIKTIIFFGIEHLHYSDFIWFGVDNERPCVSFLTVDQ